MVTTRIAVLVSFFIYFVPTPAQSTLRVIEAVKAHDREALRELIGKGTDVNTLQGDGAAAIHWVAHSGDLEAATLLIDAGADVKVANALGATPLWLAATNGDGAMVELLLEAGADPNTALKMGETSLMAAARSGSVSTVERLLEYGADVNAKEIERGQTALMWAVAQQHRDVTQVLIRSGANLHVRSKVYYQFENTAGNTNPSGNFEMAHGGSTPLLFSARNGDVDTARVLVEAGANVNDTMASGMSALVVAAHSGHTSFSIYLLEQGAAPNAAKAGYTALHAAVLRSRPRMVEALLEYGADPNVCVEHGTPGRRFSADYSIRAQLIGANTLWLAAKYGELDILRILIESGADPHLIPKTGVSLLQAAIGLPRNSQENRRNRLDSFSQLSRVEEERLTLRLASIILGLGVDVNAADVTGNTALHHAVRKDFKSVVEFLMLNGAEGGRPNKSGQTPLMLAETPQSRPGLNSVKITRPKIAQLLRRFGVNN